MESSEFEIVAISLQENMVNLVKQLNIPLIETSLVIGKYTKQLTANLEEFAKSTGEKLPSSLLSPLPISKKNMEVDESYDGIPLEKIMEVIDHERMDIFDTLIRTSINLNEIPIYDALVVLRTWEKLVREQLVGVKSVGQLFSAVVLPDDF
mgnify:CR=1 FL=1